MGKRNFKQFSLNSLFPEMHPKTIFEHFTFKVLEKQIFPSFQVLFMHRCTVEPHTWSYLVNIKVKNMQIRYKGISIRIHDFVDELDTNIYLIEYKINWENTCFTLFDIDLKIILKWNKGFWKHWSLWTSLFVFVHSSEYKCVGSEVLLSIKETLYLYSLNNSPT